MACVVQAIFIQVMLHQKALIFKSSNFQISYSHLFFLNHK